MRSIDNHSFLMRVREQHERNLTILSPYINTRIKVRARCNVCKTEWDVIPKSLYCHGCPKCGKEVAKKTVKWNLSQDHFLSKIHQSLIGKITVIGKYHGVHGKLEVRCNTCLRKWTSTPAALYHGYGCERCGRRQKGIKSRVDHLEFLNRVKAAHGDSISVMGRYETGKTRILVKCQQCGHEWTPVAARLYRRGCPKCISSKGEAKVRRLLSENNIRFKEQYWFNDLRGINGAVPRFDFAVFQDENCQHLTHLIEYDGQQHFRPIKNWGGKKRYARQIKIDKLKNEYCRKNKIRLIRIPYIRYCDLTIGDLT